MERDLLRIKDLSLETGLMGISCYIRSRLRSNKNMHIFDNRYLYDWKSSVSIADIVEDNCILKCIVKINQFRLVGLNKNVI